MTPFHDPFSHSLIEYSMIPNKKRKNKIPNKQGVTWDYTINSDGYRGKDIPHKKGNNIKRILFLGDSYTFGWGINDDETYPAQLEVILNERNLNTIVESVNLGVPGYNTVQEYGVLIDKADLYDPDIIVLGYIMNDAEPQFSVIEDPEKAYKYANSWLLECMMWHLNRILFSKRPLFNAKIQRHNFNYVEGFQPNSLKWKESKEALRKISLFCKSRKIPVLVAIFPDFTRNFDSFYPFKTIHEQVSLWCSELAIDEVDLYQYVDGLNHKDFWIEGEGHPNAKEHKRIAEILSVYIQNIFFHELMKEKSFDGDNGNVEANL